jgi:IclR family transcriptional regulator, KDG regulon repressor
VIMNTWVGRRIEARCTALGKALIAHLPPDRFGEMFRSDALARRTGRSITSKEALKREMSRIRDRGYAIDDEECGIGVRCVAAPIFDRNGRAVLSIGMSGTTSQVTRNNLESLGAITRHAAGKISRNLGHQSVHSW